MKQTVANMKKWLKSQMKESLGRMKHWMKQLSSKNERKTTCARMKQRWNKLQNETKSVSFIRGSHTTNSMTTVLATSCKW